MYFSCCKFKQKQIWIFSVGIILLTLGIVFLAAGPKLSEEIVNTLMTLRPNSYMLSKWVVTPIPLYFNFYMFNWTNPHQANDSNVKPNFEELGPYMFREVRVKEDLKWDNDENIVTFYSRRTWYFEESKSNGSLNDLITAPHLPTLTASKIFRSQHPTIRKIVNFALNREGGRLFLSRNVKEWIFDGFYDDLMDIVSLLQSPLVGVCEKEFAYFHNRNGSKDAEGTFSMYTGENYLYKKGDLKYWKGLNHTKYWRGECSRVNGSTGEIWAPAKEWSDPVSIFFSDIKRFINVYAQANESYRGVAARRYSANELTFDSGSIAEDTKCFCVGDRECPKNGVIDFSAASNRAPMYVSLPHFNMADPLYRENTTGLNPDPEKHSIHILLEPKFGIPLYIDGRALLSARVEKDEKIDILNDLAWNFYAPLFTLQIQTTITDDILRVVKICLNLPKVFKYIGIVLTIIGVFTIGIGVYITIKHKRHEGVIVPENRKK